MTNPTVSQLIAEDHRHRLTAEAAHRRLIALATCCRPSRLVAAARALRTRVATATQPAAACCA